jgi:hypothetical protein
MGLYATEAMTARHDKLKQGRGNMGPGFGEQRRRKSSDANTRIDFWVNTQGISIDDDALDRHSGAGRAASWSWGNAWLGRRVGAA